MNLITKVFFFGAFFVSAKLSAGHFYNQSSTDGILLGDSVNRRCHLGVATSPAQATLIHPQVAITVTHGAIKGQVAVNEGIRFGDEFYTITCKVEPKDAFVGSQHDYCLLFLDRPVQGLEPRPLADFDAPIQGTTLVHTLSYNTTVQVNKQRILSQANPHHQLLYGRACIKPMLPGNEALEVTMSKEKDKDFVVPIGGDSGSPAFVQTQTGGFALAGVLSTINTFGTSARYTNLSKYKDEITRTIRRVLGVKTTLRTVGVHQFVPRPPCLSQQAATLLPMRFSGKNYWNSYEDLRRSIQKLSGEQVESAARTHYLTHGKSEGRIALSTEFNPLLYISLHRDLGDATEKMTEEQKSQWGFHHYITTGRNEGRAFFPDNFNVQDYARNYRDLWDRFSELYLWEEFYAGREHYAQHGFHEGRVFEYFSPLLYAKAYPDLASGYDVLGGSQFEKAMIQHYANFGRAEGRVPVPPTFNGKLYVSLHPDLQKASEGLNEEELELWALRHYVAAGYQEKRRLLPEGFSSYHYVLFNRDLKYISDEYFNKERRAMEHYAQHGFEEGRFCEIFSPMNYYDFYEDLQNAYSHQKGEDLANAMIHHYRTQGKKEGRIACPIIRSPKKFFKQFPHLKAQVEGYTPQALRFFIHQEMIKRLSCSR